MPDTSHLRHELRTPVNHIAGYAELLLEEEGVAEPFATGLRTLAATARDSLTAIGGIVDGAEDGPPGPLVELGERVAAMRAQLEALLAIGPVSAAADLERIREAIERLGELVAGVAPAAPGQATPAAEPVQVGTPRLPVVLVVDDDAANRDLLTRRVERLGVTVREAANGREALDAMLGGDIDLVLLDVMMPVMDGHAVLQHRRSDPALRDIPVIMISALDDSASIIRCIEAGAEDYLPKPFDPVLLKARLNACLEQKRLRDEQKLLLKQLGEQAAELAAMNAHLERRVEQKVREVERLSLLERFVPPQLGEIIAAGATELLASHRREVTVVFTDLRGFTSFAETAEPEDVMAVLRELHNGLGPLIFAYGGTLMQFTGDGMMVFFNDPVPCEEPALQAARMALDMQAKVVELADGWRRRGHGLEMGIGIAVGYATCGQVGFEGRFEYTAIGTVTNLAARLCGEAKGGQILASERIARALDGRVASGPVGHLALKGFAKPVPAFELLGG